MDAGRELSHVFELSNDGDPLRITEILSSPGCTARLLSGADIGRGEKARVEVEVETARRGGEVRAAAVLRSDDPLRPRTRLVLGARVRGAVHASPRALHFGQTIAGRLAARSLDIVMPPDEGWRVTAAESTSEHVSVEALGGDGGPERRYRIGLRHPEPVGDWSSLLVIRCESEGKSRELRVPLTARVLGKVRYPEDIAFLQKGDRHSGRTIVLSRRDGKRVRIARVEDLDDRLELELIEPAGRHATLRAEVSDRAAGVSFHQVGTLRVRLRERRQPSLDIEYRIE